MSKVTVHLTLAGDVILHDDDDAPLVKVTFSNEAKQMTEHAKLAMGEVIRDVLTAFVR